MFDLDRAPDTSQQKQKYETKQICNQRHSEFPPRIFHAHVLMNTHTTGERHVTIFHPHAACHRDNRFQKRKMRSDLT